MTSELMRATVAEPQGDAREGGAERSGRQSCDHRNTNRLRQQWATSTLARAKSNPHQDTVCKVGWPAAKVQDLTRGDLKAERPRGVSRGRSSQGENRGPKAVRLNTDTGHCPAKGRRNQQQRSTEHCA